MKYIIATFLLIYGVGVKGQEGGSVDSKVNGRIDWLQHEVDKLFSITGSHESMLRVVIVEDNKRIDSLESRIRWLEARPYLDIGFFVGGHPNREVWMIDPKGKYSLTLKRFDYIDSTGEIITKQ